jgi:voltage-gated potassium channel Kch
VKARPTPRQRLRYAFDNLMARGTPALIGWLALVAAALIALLTAVILIGNFAPREEHHGIIGQAFAGLLHALDPGTIANDKGKWPFLLVMLLITIGGLFIISALIGVLATGLDRRIEEMRKGRSMVLEEGHTLILGWSETIFTVLSELEIANESQKRPVAVVLAERDKAEMDDLIREKARPKRTRIVTRSGSPIDLGHLALVRAEKARSIVVLSPEAEEEPDAQVIKTILALTRGDDHSDEAYHVVAEIREPRNLEAARLVGGEEVVLVDKRETIARLVVHSARQSGASVAFIELLDFEGDEIYFRDDKSLYGRSFGEALLAYEDCAPIGLVDSGGSVRLNPPPQTAIAAGEQVIAIAADDARLAAAGPWRGTISEEAISTQPATPFAPERVLIVGWNQGALAVVREFDQFLLPGSSLVVVSDDEEAKRAIEARPTVNATTELHVGSPTDREVLEEVALEGFDHVIVLSPEGLDAQRADARTLIVLLHLRNLADRLGAEFTIVSEMIDDRNRQLAEVTQVDDVIVSDKIISLMLTQISENRQLSQVFAELFSAGGSELYLRPAGDYVLSGVEVEYATVVESARRRGECAIGYRVAALAKDASASFGVRVNPPKSERVTLGGADRVVVLAEGLAGQGLCGEPEVKKG